MYHNNPEMASMTPEEYRKKREEYFAQEQQQAAEKVESFETRMNEGSEEIMYNGQWTKCFELPPDHPCFSPF